MKRLILLVAVAVLTAGCGVVLRGPSEIANRVRIGMSVDEFRRLAGQWAELDEMTADYTVYRIQHWAGPENDRHVASVKLYHFGERGKLVKVETRDLTSPFFPRNPQNRPQLFEPLIP
jgi:uncharacterized protein YceK